MEKIHIFIQCNNSFDNTSQTILKCFKNKASADHFKHDKEC